MSELAQLEFYGHLVFGRGLFPNLLLPFLTLGLLWILIQVEKISHKNLRNALSGVLAYVYLIFLPNGAYMCLEFKHLVLVDNVADNLEPAAVVVFGVMSLLGLLWAAVLITSATAYTDIFGRHPDLSMICLSYLSATGAVIGLTEVTSIQGLLNPLEILKVLPKAGFNPGHIVLIFILGSVIWALCLDTYRSGKLRKSTPVAHWRHPLSAEKNADAFTN